MGNEDLTWKRFMAVCYIIGCIFLLATVYIWAFGVPKFSNVDGERQFCLDNGGMPIEPSRENYNTLLCIFEYDFNETTKLGKWMATAPEEVTNEEWKRLGNYKYDYCFHCWDSPSCESPYNDVLRAKGVHC